MGSFERRAGEAVIVSRSFLCGRMGDGITSGLILNFARLLNEQSGRSVPLKRDGGSNEIA